MVPKGPHSLAFAHLKRRSSALGPPRDCDSSTVETRHFQATLQMAQGIRNSDAVFQSQWSRQLETQVIEFTCY